MKTQIQFRIFCILGILLGMFGYTACASPTPKSVTPITIGVINLSPLLEPVLDGFQSKMTALGYTHVTYLYDGPSPDLPTLDKIAQDLVAAQPELIVSISTPASQAIYRTNTSIPVIFGPVTDPIAAGIVINLTNPDGNMTGTRLGLESEEQRLKWLLDIAPGIEKIFVPYNSNDSSSQSSVQAATIAAEKLGVVLVLMEARNTDEITYAIQNIPSDVQAIFLPQDSLVAARIDDFAAVAIARQLPLCTPTDGQVERGALLSYSFKLATLGEQMARMADQVLQGVPTAQIPVETAEFFLSVNLQTANAIHLTVPEEILRATDNIVR